jgi:hypothetical protein
LIGHAGRQVLDDEEYTISDGEYSNYATVNWEDGYVTPFDVNTEVCDDIALLVRTMPDATTL